MLDLKTTLEEAVTKKKPCYFFSPHLDDAVLSCGSLLSYLSGKTEVTVVTVFTEATVAPYSFSARRFLQKCGETNAKTLFRKRRKEDALVMKKLGVTFKHLGEIDGTWRRTKSLGKLRKSLGKFIPELLFEYPTFLNVAFGKLTKSDKEYVQEIRNSVLSSLPKNAVIFAPLAIGKHVDHVFIREIFSELPQTIYWSDFPYNLKNEEDEEFISSHKLKQFGYDSSESKEELIELYASQLPSLFPNGKIPEKEESYFIASNASTY